MSADWIDLRPRTLRVMAWGCFILGALFVLTVILSFVGEPPEWNRVARIGEAFGWWYVGAIHADLARARQRVIA